MQVDFNILLLYVVTVVAMIAVPGPVVILVTGAGLAGGPGRALRTIFGTNAASLVLIALSGLVVKGIFSVNETLFNLLKIAGACYIAYIGISLVLESRHVEQENFSIQRKAGGFLNGFSMAISNPKDIVFFASFFPQFMGITQSKNISILILTGVWILLDFTTLMTVYFLISKIVKPSIHRTMLRGAGVLLVLIACVGIAMSGIALIGHSQLL